jgi:protein TonB
MALKLLRYPVALLVGLFLNGFMFWLLWSLTNVKFDAHSIEATRIEFTRMVRDTQTETRRDEKVERTPPPVTPDLPQMNLSSGNVDTTLVKIAPVVDTHSAIKIGINNSGSREAVPLVRINPEYPQRASSRGIEGWVQVQFTITETGTVINAKVVASDPPNIFDDAAIKAILRWRYNPMVEEGKAVSRPGMQTILRFNLEN